MSSVQQVMTANLVGAQSPKQVAELVVSSGGRGKAKTASDIQARVLAYADLGTLDAWADKLAACLKENPAPREGGKSDGPWWGPVLEWVDELAARRVELEGVVAQSEQTAEIHQLGEAAA